MIVARSIVSPSTLWPIAFSPGFLCGDDELNCGLPTSGCWTAQVGVHLVTVAVAQISTFSTPLSMSAALAVVVSFPVFADNWIDCGAPPPLTVTLWWFGS